PELLRVHLAEALVTLDLEALAALRHHPEDRLLQVRDLVGGLSHGEAEGWIARLGQLACETPDLFELRADAELAVDHVPVRSTVPAVRDDDPRAGMLPVVFEREADRHEMRRGDREIALRAAHQLLEALGVTQSRRVHQGLAGERHQHVSVSPLALEDVED